MALIPPWRSTFQGSLQGGGLGSFGPLGGWNGQVTGLGNFYGFGPYRGYGSRGKHGRAMAMYQQLVPGGALIPNALLPPPIPRSWGRKGQNAYFDSGNIWWRFPQEMIRRQWPALAQEYRASGGRVLTSSQVLGFGNNPAGLGALVSALPQLQGSADAWDVLMSLIGRNGSRSCGFNGQPDYFEQLFDRLRAAHFHIVQGYSINGLDYRSNLLLALSTIESISWIIAVSGSSGFGVAMYWDLLNLLYYFAAILGDIDGPAHTYTYCLFECIARIFGNGQGEITACLSALSLGAQQELLNECWNEVVLTNDTSGLPCFIYNGLKGV